MGLGVGGGGGGGWAHQWPPCFYANQACFSPTNGRHVFMLIKLVLVLFVKVQLLTILDSGHMLHRNRLLKFLTQAYMENLPRPW